jgi:hypothetical protein
MATWTPLTKSPNAVFTPVVKTYSSNNFLLAEDGSYLLLETGDKIIISGSDEGWTNQTKN